MLSLRAFSDRYELELRCSPAMLESLIVCSTKAVPTSSSYPTLLSCTVSEMATKIGLTTAQIQYHDNYLNSTGRGLLNAASDPFHLGKDGRRLSFQLLKHCSLGNPRTHKGLNQQSKDHCCVTFSVE